MLTEINSDDSRDPYTLNLEAHKLNASSNRSFGKSGK